ncbi:MAG: hypothetical protein WD794_10095 [Mycobacteriales bacterium]
MDAAASDDEAGGGAVPGVYRGDEGRSGPVLLTLDVDGEVFAVRDGGDGGTHYHWVSGPNRHYGFGSSGAPDLPVEEHRKAIRTFLSMIDPKTGYIAED